MKLDDREARDGMKKASIDECIDLTERIITQYYQGDIALLCQYLHKQCLWIGSNANEYYDGKDHIISVIKKAMLPPIILSSKEFQCVMSDRRSCVIVGRYVGITDISCGEIYRDLQRVTFTWKKECELLYLTHMHVSNPLTAIGEGENFPHQIGSFTKEYLDMLIKKEVEKSGYLIIKDQDNITHRIQISNILYLEAFNVNTMIHMMKQNIFARASITAVERQIKAAQEDMFIRVHKSFSVNRFYIISIRQYELQLAGGNIVPIPKGKYTQLKEQLHMHKI